MNSCEQNPKKILLLWGPHARQEHLIETVENLKTSEGDKTIIVVENFERFVVAGHASSSFDTVLTSTLTSHPVEVFGEIARVLKLGRTAVIRESVTIEDNVPNLRTPPKLRSSLILSGFVNVGMPIALPKTKSNVEDYKKYFAFDEKSILFVEIEASKPNFEVGASIPVASIKKFKKGNEKMILDTEDEQLLIENIQKTSDELFCLQTRLKARMNNEKTKEELEQLSNKEEELRNLKNQHRKFLRETGRLPKTRDTLLYIETLSKSIRDSNAIEERREVAIQRWYKQLGAANLYRGSIRGQPKDFSDKKMIVLTEGKRLLIENIQKASDALFCLQTRLKARMNNEKTKEELEQLSNKEEELRNAKNQYRKFLNETGLLPETSESLFGLKTLSKSIRDSDPIEERRQNTRREVAIKRSYNQLRAADLNRGLFVDQTFDLTPLDEALPSVSHCKRAPGMKRRTLKLQDIVMNNVKERRLIRRATAGLCSMDTTSLEQNS